MELTSPMKRVLAVGFLSTAMTVSFVGVAAAQPEPEPEPEPPPPTEVDCDPLSIACGLQIGPNNFDIDILPGGSVFPPQPPPDSE